LSAAIEQPIVQRVTARLAAEAARKEQELRVREEKLALAGAQLEKQLESERTKLKAESEKNAKEAVSLQLRDLEQQLSEKSKKIREAEQAQLALLQQRRALEDEKASFEIEKARQMESEREKIRADAAKVAVEKATAELQELRTRLEQKDKRLLEAEAAELKLRQEREQFEEQKRALDLELARRTDQIKADVAQVKDEEFRLKFAEKEKQLSDVNRQLDEAKRKAEQGSQQSQGEVLELDLEAALRRCFGSDEVVPVPKGVHGGDLLQVVRDESGHDCGSIIWESKRTKKFSDGWLGKLKQDKLAAQAHLAVLVTTAMPDDVTSFECRENVWITPPKLAVALGGALRLVLMETAAARRALDGRHDKMSVVYDYLAGPHFKARVTAIVEAFTTMRQDLEAEKRAMQRSWSKREKQIDLVLANTVGMHGELAGIIGRSLPTIEMLELESPPALGLEAAQRHAPA